MTHSGDVREPPGVRGTEIIHGTSGQGTTRSQGLQQETGLILGMSGNYQEPGATARDRIHSGDVREPPGGQKSFTKRQVTTRRQGHSREGTGLIQGMSGNHQDSGSKAGVRIPSGNARETPGV
jgi:hypothetical protein